MVSSLLLSRQILGLFSPIAKTARPCVLSNVQRHRPCLLHPSIPWQIPPNPRAVVLMIHGCAGTAFNWWPQSASCNNCRGMPEQMSHTIQALARGYAGEGSLLPVLLGLLCMLPGCGCGAGCWCCVASCLAVAVTGGDLCWLALLLLMLQWTRCCWLLPPPM